MAPLPSSDTRPKQATLGVTAQALLDLKLNPTLVCYELDTNPQPVTYTGFTWDELDSAASGDTSITNPSLRNKFRLDKKDENFAFMCTGDIRNMVKFAYDNKVYISVRNTGPQTIACLTKAGYACKPHEIGNKTIKPKSTKGAKADLQRFRSLQPLPTSITFCASPSDPTPGTNPWWKNVLPAYTPTLVNKDGQLALSNASAGATLKDIADTLEKLFEGASAAAEGLVGWWVTIKAGSAEFTVPIGILKVGQLNTVDKTPVNRAGEGVLFGAAGPFPPLDAYTGDYDLHCVFMEYKQPAQGTVAGVYDGSYQGGLGSVVRSLNRDTPFVRQRQQPDGSLVTDPLARLFQHGPQGGFDDYLLRHNHELPYLQHKLAVAQGASSDYHQEIPNNKSIGLLAPDDEGVLAFTPDGAVHLMTSLPQMLAFYRCNGLDSDPFTLGTANAVDPNSLKAFECKANLQQAPDVQRRITYEVTEKQNSVVGYTTGLLATEEQTMVILMNPLDHNASLVEEVKNIIFGPTFSRRRVNCLKNVFQYVYRSPINFFTNSGKLRWACASTWLCPPLVCVLGAALMRGDILKDATLEDGVRQITLVTIAKVDPPTLIKNYSQAGYPLSAATNGEIGVQCSSAGETQRIIWN